MRIPGISGPYERGIRALSETDAKLLLPEGPEEPDDPDIYREKGENIKIGLMKLVSVVADRKLPVKRGDLILNMARVCDALEGSGEDMMIMNKDMICRD